MKAIFIVVLFYYLFCDAMGYHPPSHLNGVEFYLIIMLPSIILLSFDHLCGVFAGNFEAAVGDEREGNNKH